jgi:hypothetical protein
MTIYRCLDKYQARTQAGAKIIIYIMEGLGRKRTKLFAKTDLDLEVGLEYVLDIQERVITSAVVHHYKAHPKSYTE